MSAKFGEGCLRAYFGVASRICPCSRESVFILRNSAKTRKSFVNWVCCVYVIIVHYSDPDFFFFCEHTIPDSLFSASVWNFEDLQYFDWYSWKLETEYGLKTWNINDSFLNLTRLMLTAVLPRAFCFRTRFHPICFQNSSKRGQWFTAYYQKVWLPRGCKQDLYPLGKRHS